VAVKIYEYLISIVNREELSASHLGLFIPEERLLVATGYESFRALGALFWKCWQRDL
jgi:hypothetical protein